MAIDVNDVDVEVGEVGVAQGFVFEIGEVVDGELGDAVSAGHAQALMQVDVGKEYLSFARRGWRFGCIRH